MSKFFRKVDDLGRLIIPKEVRREMSIGEDDLLEITFVGKEILIKKYEGDDTALQKIIRQEIAMYCKDKFDLTAQQFRDAIAGVEFAVKETLYDAVIDAVSNVRDN